METGLLEETEAVGGVGRGRVGRGGSGLTGLESLPVQVALIFLFFFSVRSRTSLAPGRLAAGGPGHLTVFFSVDRNWNLKDVRECWGIGFKTRKKLDGIEIDEFGKKKENYRPRFM
jgi:hypothetical protein